MESQRRDLEKERGRERGREGERKEGRKEGCKEEEREWRSERRGRRERELYIPWPPCMCMGRIIPEETAMGDWLEANA